MGRGQPTLVAGGMAGRRFQTQGRGRLDSVLGSLCCAPEPPEGEAPSRPVDQRPQGPS